jgi:hypothetical protein
MSGADPWADFRVSAEPPPANDPWAEFRVTEPRRGPVTTGEVLTGLGRTGLDIADKAVRTLARGATMNFADEIAASARSGSIGGLTPNLYGNYEQALTEERRRDAEFDARNPGLSLAGQMVGGAALPVRLASGASSMLGAVARGAGTGAAFGATAGFGEGQGGLVPRSLNAAEGAVVGGALGAAIPPALAGATALGGLAGRLTGTADRTAPAQRLFLRDLERDAISPEELLRRSTAAGEAPLGLVDLAGENVRQAGSAIARMPGEGQRMAGALLTERGGAAQADRLRSTVREVVNADDYTDTLARVVKSRREDGQENYARAYERMMPNDPRLSRFLSDKDVQKGIFEGMESLRRDALIQDRPFDPSAFGMSINDRGQIVLGDGPIPTQLIDAAKRGLDALEEASRTSTGAATSKSREISGLRRALLERADELNPDFAKARAAYAGDTALINAARDGRRLAVMRPEDFEMTAADLRGMSESEREFFRLGVARGLIDRINSAPDNAEATRLRQMFGTEFMRERMRAIFDKPEDYTRFSQMMDQEMAMAQTNRAINPQGGSPTMPLTARREDLATPPRGPVIGSIIGRDPSEGFNVGDVTRAYRFGGADYAAQRVQEQASRARSASALERNAADYARMLFTTPSSERSRMAEALLQRGISEGARNRLAASLGQALLRDAGIVGGQADVPGVPRLLPQ